MPIVFADGFDHYTSTGTDVLHLGNAMTGWYGGASKSTSQGNFVTNRGGKALNLRMKQYPGISWYGEDGLYRQFSIVNNQVTIGFSIRWIAGSSNSDTAAIKIGTAAVFSTSPTTSDNASVFRLTTSSLDGYQVFKVIYNGVTTILDQWIFNSTIFYYFEFQFDTTASTGYAKMKINGVLAWESLNNPPNQTLSTIGGFVLNTGADNAAYLDDFYIATGDANFYGPLTIDDATNVTLQNSLNYTANTGTLPDALSSLDTTSWATTTNLNSNVVLKATTTNALGYLVHQCSRNLVPVPYSLQTTEGENDLAMNDRVNYNVITSFLRRQHVLLAADILDAGDPVDGNGSYHFFGFRIKDNTI